MGNKIKDRTKEKLELAGELGMKNWKDTKEHELAVKKDIKDMTAMKMKPITKKEIKDKLTFKLWHGFRYQDYEGNKSSVGLYGSIFGGLGVGVFLSFIFYLIIDIPNTGVWELTTNQVIFAWCIPLILSATSFALYCLSRYKNCAVKIMKLDKWEDNIPYGGMLAVKEATEKGLGSFHIAYPCKDEDRIMTDPIIVGFSDYGNIYEIF